MIINNSSVNARRVLICKKEAFSMLHDFFWGEIWHLVRPGKNNLYFGIDNNIVVHT